MKTENLSQEKYLKMKEVKAKLAWFTCKDKLFKDNSAAPKGADERSQFEPQIVRILDTLIDRVKMKRKNAGEHSNYKLVTAALQVTQYRCDRCNNKDQNCFVEDKLTGIICVGASGSGCGFVIQDQIIDIGAARRNFEGEEEKNHHGPAPQKNMSDAWNMSTSVSSIGKNGRENYAFKKLAEAARELDMGLSQIGSVEKRTRVGHKDKKKREAHNLLKEMAAQFGIHSLTVDNALEE